MRILSPGAVVFDRYLVEGFVGEGGMQEVYRAKDLALDRIVALKTPKNDHGSKRFQRSAIVSAKIRHPSVATTLDYFVVGERAFLAEEFIVGVDLKKIMAETYIFLDPALTAHLATHLAKGLAACHEENIWHRDLKPANIMVTDELVFSEVKITDFGIAKMVEEEFKDDSEGGAESSITGSQTLVGAAPFMAPEHMFTPKSADKRADIWSFGAILYNLMCGAPPFGRSFASIAVALQSGAVYAPPPQWMKQKTQFLSVHDGLWEIIRTCLVVDPALRPTARQLVQKLSALCFSVYPRIKGTTKGYILPGGRSSFVQSSEGDALYHLDSYFKEGRIMAGEYVAFSIHPGTPSGRAFPVVPLRPPAVD
jgi:serine/threonine-protein kinase